MKKEQRHSRKTKRIFATFASLVLALGVGVALAPKDVVKAEAASLPATMTAGNSAQKATVNGKEAIKVGTGKVGGDMTVTVGNGATKLSFYAAGWNGENPTVSLSGATTGTASFALTADSGIAGSGTAFTLNGNESDCYFETTLSGITSDTPIKFSVPSKNNRFVIWDASYEVSSSAPESMTLDVTNLNLDILDTHQLVPSFEPKGAIAGVSYSVTTQNPEGVVSVNESSGLVTALKQGTATIKATTTDGSNLSASVSVTVSGNYSSSILTPAQAHELAVGDNVIVRGKVVTDIYNYGSYAIQVGDRGIMTYGVGTLTVGNEVIIAGEMAAFNGMPQVGTPTNVIDLGPSTTTVTPKVITSVSELTAKLSGTLVQIEGMKYGSGTFTAGSDTNVELSLGEKIIQIRSTKNMPAAPINDANAIFSSAGADDTLNITTTAGWFNGAQLLFSGDTVIEKISPAFGTLDKIELKTTSVKDSYYVGEEFSLESLVVTAYDTANIEKIVTEDATSSLAVGYTFNASDIGSKTITITYVEGGVTKTASFTITVEAAPTWTKATLSYSGSTGNLKADTNNATTVGLDSEIFDVKAIKGSAGNNVGINADGTIRLYFHASGGNTLSVSIGPDKVISKLVFNFAGTTAKAKILVDGVEKYNNTPAEDSSLPLEGLDATSFSIQNVNASNTQLWIRSIEIYYESTSSYEADALAFATEVMTGSGFGAEGNCQAVLEGLETMYDGLSEMAQLEFETNTDELFENARARLDYLRAWVALNGETRPSSENANNSNNTLIAALVIGAIGITTLGGYFFLNKKRHLEK